jgi:hypothetical protein
MVDIAKMFPHTQFICHASTYAIENLASFDNLWFGVVQHLDGQGSERDFKKAADNPGWSMPETPIRQHRHGEPGDLWAAEENNPVRLTGLS